jgi:hypothetical protein
MNLLVQSLAKVPRCSRLGAASRFLSKDVSRSGSQPLSAGAPTIVGDGLLNMILWDEIPQVLKDDIDRYALPETAPTAAASTASSTIATKDTPDASSNPSTAKPPSAMHEILSLSAALRYLPLNTSSSKLNLGKYVSEKFKHLNQLHSDNKLEDRERYFCAALNARRAGDYIKAARILETWLDNVPSDVTALRLAQDFYLDGGDANNTFSCVTMCWLSLMDNNTHHGNVMGMLGCGLLERGNLQMCEETLNQAIGFSKQKDMWSIHSLMNLQLVRGQGSSVLSLYEMNCEDVRDAYAKQMFRFNLSRANVLIGNTSRAVGLIDDMMEVFNSPGSIKTVHALSLATSALWYSSLWHHDVEVSLRFRSSEFLDNWMHVLETQAALLTPWHMTCALFALSGALARTDDEALQARIKQIVSTHQYIDDIQKPDENSNVVVSWFKNQYKKIANKSQVPLYTQLAISYDLTATDHKEYFRRLASDNNDDFNSDFGISDSSLVRNDYRLLESSGDFNNNSNRRKQFVDKVGGQLFEALTAFAQG